VQRRRGDPVGTLSGAPYGAPSEAPSGTLSTVSGELIRVGAEGMIGWGSDRVVVGIVGFEGTSRRDRSDHSSHKSGRREVTGWSF